MSFLQPLAFAFAATIPIVILLYLLKLKRVELIISSTYLWRKSIEDLTANAPFQRLRKNLLLFLQILTLAALVFALSRPFTMVKAREDQNLILLIDNSASMQARDVPPTRMARARTIAKQIINDLASRDEMMIITFADAASMKTSFTDDKVLLRKIVNEIQSIDTPTLIAEALSIAESFARERRNPEVIIVSDGAIRDLADVRELSVPVKFISVCERKNNVGITQMSVRRGLKQKDSFYTFVRVENFSESDVQTIVSLYYNDELIDAREIRVAPGKAAPVLFAHRGLKEGFLRAEIDVDDDLPLDNTGWKVIAEKAAIDVLLVASGRHQFLEKALLLDPFVKVSRVDPKSYHPALGQEPDITIFVSFNPEKIAGGNFLFINCLPPIEGIRADGFVEHPLVITWDSEHPAMKYLNLGNLRIAKAQKLVLPSWAAPLAVSNAGAVIADVSTAGSKILVVGFDITDSNWPLRISFPLFVSNAVRWLPERKLGLMNVNLTTGEALPLYPTKESLQAVVTTPAGRRHTVELSAGATSYFSATRKAGVYKVTWLPGEEERPPEAALENEQLFSANLLDGDESNTAPREAIEIQGKKSHAVKGPVTYNREIWDIFALAAFAVLLLEWYIYTRRAWV